MIDFSLNFSPAWGGPTTSGIIKQKPEDFRVDELSNTEFTDDGEHLYLLIEKTNLTTEQCCKEIARVINKPSKVVSYAGLKDKHGITTQWISIHCPGEDVSPLLPENGEGWRIIERRRHNKKLKIGWLKGNRFRVVVRDVTQSETLLHQLNHIKDYGLPNYFGHQRFGHQGNNLYQALQWFNYNKKVKNPFMKGILLSSARAYLFNKQLSKRVKMQTWNKAVSGDVLQLTGTHSIFVADILTDEIQRRVDDHDISPCGQLVGIARIMCQSEAHEVMKSTLLPYQEFVDGLMEKKVNADWRSFVLKPNKFDWQWLSDNQCALTFELPAGSYATTILQELFQYQGLKENFLQTA